MTALLVTITGRVQGVGFRDWLVAEADWRGVRGWVRNTGRDRVEALLCGEEAAVATVLAACRRGPRAAVVLEVTTSPASPTDDPGFRRRASV